MSKKKELYKRHLNGESIRDLANEYKITQKVAKMFIASVEREDRKGWISVEEAVPEDDEFVLLTVKYKDGNNCFVCSGYIEEGMWFANSIHYNEEIREDTVLAWMPKPKAYDSIKFDYCY